MSENAKPSRAAGDTPLRVLALTKYGRRAASSRHRFLDYMPLLGQRGIDVTWAPLLSDAYVDNLFSGRAMDFTDVARAYLRRMGWLTSATRYDLLWIEGELFPRLPALAERALAGLGRPYVVDLDDAIFHTYDHHPWAPMRQVLGRKIDVVLAKASAVAAGNAYIAERARAGRAERVTVIPTTVEPGDYPQVERDPDAPLTIGWIGSPATSHYLKTIETELAELLTTLRANLHLIGVEPGHVSIPGAVCRPWSRETEGAELAACDLGLSPLFDGPWERGKCGLKAIQYMAAGMPVVAADVGVLPSIVTHGKNGLLYRDGEGFKRCLRELAANPDLRLKMGRAGRKRVEDDFAAEKWADVLAGLFTQAVRDRTG